MTEKINKVGMVVIFGAVLAKLTMEAWVAGFWRRPGCGEQSFSTTARYW